MWVFFAQVLWASPSCPSQTLSLCLYVNQCNRSPPRGYSNTRLSPFRAPFFILQKLFLDLWVPIVAFCMFLCSLVCVSRLVRCFVTTCSICSFQPPCHCCLNHIHGVGFVIRFCPVFAFLFVESKILHMDAKTSRGYPDEKNRCQNCHNLRSN